MSNQLTEDLKRIAEETIQCEGACAGFKKDLKHGILPRGLVFDENEISGDKPGIIFLGFNPGHCRGCEKGKYIEDPSFDSILACWDREQPHYKKTEDFAKRVFGHACRVVWTDIIKCESVEKGLKAKDIKNAVKNDKATIFL